MRLTLLGTGTPAPSLQRQGASHLVRIGADTILFDHGQGAGHRLLQAGVLPQEVTALFLTHLHYDHMADYPRLLLQHWDQRAPAPLRVWGPAPLARVTERLIGEDGAFGPDIASRTAHPASLAVYRARGGMGPRPRPAPRVTEVAPGDRIAGDGWQVSVAAARHFEPWLSCLAYRLDTEGGSLCYAGDSGGRVESVIALAAGADVLIHMCHFASGTEPDAGFRATNGGHLDVAETARRAGVGTLVLTHFGEALVAPDGPDRLETVRAEAAAVFPGEVVIGRDLLEIDIAAARAAREGAGRRSTRA